MQRFIGPTLLASNEAQPKRKPFEIYDCRLHGFTLRVQPSGVRSYYARFGRNRRVAIGQAGMVEPDEARERCQKVLGNVARGCHPLHGLGGTDGITLGMFIADTYTTWVNASHPRTAADTLEKLYRHFSTWYPEPLTAITVERVEAWKARLRIGRTTSGWLHPEASIASEFPKSSLSFVSQGSHAPIATLLRDFSSHTKTDAVTCRTGVAHAGSDRKDDRMRSPSPIRLESSATGRGRQCPHAPGVRRTRAGSRRAASPRCACDAHAVRRRRGGR